MTTKTPPSRPPSRRRPKETTTSLPHSPALPKGEPAPAAVVDRPVVLAAVTGAHGIAGEVKLKLFTDDLAVYRSFNGGTLTLLSLRGAIARFAEVRDRNGAEALRGTTLTVPRSALPPLGEGEYYHADLLDLPVEDEAGEAIGRVVEIDNFGAGDVIEVERPDGRRFMVPMRAEAVPSWDADRLVVSRAYADG